MRVDDEDLCEWCGIHVLSGECWCECDWCGALLSDCECCTCSMCQEVGS